MPHTTLAPSASPIASIGAASVADGPRGGDGVELVRVVQHGRLRRARGVAVVMHRDGVQELGPRRPGRGPSCAPRSAAGRGARGRAAGPPRSAGTRARDAALARARDRAGAPPRAAGPSAAVDGAARSRARASPRRPCARAGRRRTSGASPRPGSARNAARSSSSPTTRPTTSASPPMRDLGCEELQEPIQLVGIAAHPRGELRRIRVRGLERAQLELEPVAEARHASEHADGVALREARVEELDVVPDPARRSGRSGRRARARDRPRPSSCAAAACARPRRRPRRSDPRPAPQSCSRDGL